MTSSAVGLFTCTVATAMMIGCGPIYAPMQSYPLARDLEARPLDVAFNLRGVPVRVDVDGAIVEGTVAEVETEAVRIGSTWYARERMRDPGDGYARNMLTGVGFRTRFIDSVTGETIDRSVDANRIRRIQISGRWYETSRIRFLDTPRFSNRDLWADQRVRIKTRDGRTYEALLVPIDLETFSMDGKVFAVSDLEAFTTVKRCVECEGARTFLYVMIAASLIVVGVPLALALRSRSLPPVE